MRNLKALDLSRNEFSGSTALKGLCKLNKMQEIDLSKNKLVGQFPLCLTSLTGLRILDFTSNDLTGKLPYALGNLESLEYLSLFDNNFEGIFSLAWLANLSELRLFKLSSKSNSLQVVSESSWKPKFQLRIISLRSCSLEKVPHFLLDQKDLHQVDLSDNIISGIFPWWLLVYNTKLEVLLIENNSLTSFKLPKRAHSLNVSANEFNHLFPENFGWILPHLRYLNLAYAGFHGNLPSSFGNMKKVEVLDISHNSFHGELPRSFIKGCYSLRILKLSHNKLSGEIFLESTNFTHMTVLFMDNNQFTGKIGQGLRRLRFLSWLDISNNHLIGVIPTWIDELSLLSALLISDNFLKGEIHVSMFNISGLQLLDLSANMLSGDIPARITSIAWIALDNNLSGTIPNTLLVNVTTLDLRNNRLSGNLPEFINTPKLYILLLRGNNFTARIPHQLCTLRNIHLMDLSNNRFNRSVPSCLSNTSFGLGKEDTPYVYDFRIYVFTSFNPLQGSISRENVSIHVKSLLMLDHFRLDYKAGTQTKIEFATKRRYDTYMGRNINLLFGLDLSENELSGEIPVELGGLLELRAFNLSHNNLSGVIPKSFSGMKKYRKP